MPKDKGNNQEYTKGGDIADMYGVDIRTVQRWGKLEGVKKGKRGEYVLPSIVRAVYEEQKKLILHRGDETITEKKGLKLDKTNELLDIEIADKKKMFVDAIDLEKTLGKIFVEFKNIRLIPRSYGAQISGICQEFISGEMNRKGIKGWIMRALMKKRLTAKIENLLVKQIDKALENLSRGFDPKGKKWRG